MAYTPYVLPEVRVSGSPFEIGKAYGEATRDRIVRHLDNQRKAMAQLRPEQPGWWQAEVRTYLTPYEELAPYFVEEMEGIARGAGIPFSDILMLNVRDELIVAHKPLLSEGCTSFGCSGSVTASGQPLFGQTKDTGGISKDLFVVLNMRQRGRPDLLQMPYAGELGVFGLSSSGMAIFGNSLYVQGRGRGHIPISLMRRLALEADGVPAVLTLADQHGLMTPGNFLIGDRTGRAIALETTDHGHAVIEAREGILVHTNHIVDAGLVRYETYDEPERSASYTRRERLTELLAGERGRLTPQLAMRFLGDHRNYPRSICRHGPGTVDSETTSAVVVEPTLGLLHAVRGQPCRGWAASYSL